MRKIIITAIVHFRLTINTLFYLKPRQIIHMIWFYLKRRLVRINMYIDKNMLLKEINKINDQMDNSLCIFLLNKKQKYDKHAIGWIDPKQEKLWRYHLNSFDYINNGQEKNINTQLYLILDWIDKNFDDRAETWEPYVISRRIVNWIKWLNRSADFTRDYGIIIRQSIYYQCKRLILDIEYHIDGNHLFENFKAAFVSSAYLLMNAKNEYEDAKLLAKWFAKSAKELIKILNEQILDNGAYCELTPMYHNIVYEGLLEIKLAIDKIHGQPNTKKILESKELIKLTNKIDLLIPKMKEWLSFLLHPDQDVALFNDSVLGMMSERNIDSNLNKTKVDEVKLLAESGYFIKRWDNNYFIMDCGNPAPTYQPGHSHCDALSYELSIAGHRFIVDSGCGSYQNEAIRKYCRSTFAHNVLHIKGIEQSEIWGNFRIARRSQVLNKKYYPEQMMFESIIKDYCGNVFERKVVFGINRIDFLDTLKKRSSRGEFESLIHVSPEFKIEMQDHALYAEKDRIKISISSIGNMRVRDSKYYPEFGKEISNSLLIISGANEENQIKYTINYMI